MKNSTTASSQTLTQDILRQRITLTGLMLMGILFALLVSNTASAAVVSDSAKARIARYLPAKSFGLFTPTYGKKVSQQLKTGQDLVLAINTQGMKSVNNRISIMAGNSATPQFMSKVIEIRIDPKAPVYRDIETNQFAESILYYRFNLPDTAKIDGSGRLQLQMYYTAEGISGKQFASAPYDLAHQRKSAIH